MGTCRDWCYPGVGVSSWTLLPAGPAPQLQVSWGIPVDGHPASLPLGKAVSMGFLQRQECVEAAGTDESQIFVQPHPPDPRFCSRL